jgi:thiol-disulfide isomerase/thioredoxin
MPPVNDESRPPSKFSRQRWTIALLAAILVVAGAIYGIGPFKRNADEHACGPAAALAQRLAPLARGEVAALQIADEPHRLPNLAFTDEAGKPRNLADWRGRTALLNLWATWCVPCRKEMPALAELERKLGGKTFEVVTVNIDTRDPDKPKAWLKDVGVNGLTYYADPSAKVFQDLKLIGKAFGMPTTLLIDPAGCEIATLAGPAEWASDDAVTFIRTALAK